MSAPKLAFHPGRAADAWLSLLTLGSLFFFSPCRLVEEVKELCDGLELENEDVYMATTFGDFIQLLVRKLRGEDGESECVINYVSAAL
jgi:hypothetical protein